MRKTLCRWWWLPLLVAAVGLGALAWSPPGLNWINYCKIRKGMTENDVSRLLGGPPRFTDPVGFDAQWADDNDSATIHVNWDANGGVMKKSYWAGGLHGDLQRWLQEHGIN
jgi:hypothetical protein